MGVTREASPASNDPLAEQGTDGHRAKLVEGKLTPLQPDPRLAEQNRPAVAPQHQAGDDHEQRRQKNHSQKGGGKIKGPFTHQTHISVSLPTTH